jgi:hypothetical protein
MNSDNLRNRQMANMRMPTMQMNHHIPIYPMSMTNEPIFMPQGYQIPQTNEERINVKYERSRNESSDSVQVTESNNKPFLPVKEKNQFKRTSQEEFQSMITKKEMKKYEPPLGDISSSVDNRTSSVGQDNSDTANRIFKITKSKSPEFFAQKAHEDFRVGRNTSK